MAQGHAGGAYAKLERTPNYVGEALTNLGNVAFRDRQFKQENEDKVKAQKAAEQKAINDKVDAIKPMDLKTATTLNDNLEVFKTKAAFEIQRNDLALQDEIALAKDKNKVADLTAKRGNLKLAYDKLIGFSENINARRADIEKNPEKYDPDSLNEYMTKSIMRGKGYGSLRFDQNYNPIFDDTDENGNVLKTEGGQNRSLSGFLAENEDNLMLKSTFNDDLKKAVDDLGVKTTQTENGTQTTKISTPTEEAKKVAKEAFINEFLNKKNNRYRFSKDNNLDSKNEDVLRQEVGSLFDSKISNTYEKSTNVGLLNANMRAQEIAEAKTKISYAPVTENYVDETGGAKIVDYKNYLPNHLTFGTQTQKPFKNLGGSLSNLNNGFVVAINKQKNGVNKNKYLINGLSLKNKNIKYKGRDINTYELSLKADAGDTEAQTILSQQGADIYNTFTRTINRTALNSIANGIGLQDYKDVDSRISKLNPKQKVSAPVQKEKGFNAEEFYKNHKAKK